MLSDLEIARSLEESFEAGERLQRSQKRPDYADCDEDDDEGVSRRGTRGGRGGRGRGGRGGRGSRGGRGGRGGGETGRSGVKYARKRFAEDEVRHMWLFVINHLREKEKPYTPIRLRVGVAIWKKFVPIRGDKRTDVSLYVHFNKCMLPTIRDTTFDMETKTLIHYCFEIPCPPEFLRILREEEKVEYVVDKRSVIQAWRRCRGDYRDAGWDNVWDPELVATLQREEEERIKAGIQPIPVLESFSSRRKDKRAAKKERDEELEELLLAEELAMGEELPDTRKKGRNPGRKAAPKPAANDNAELDEQDEPTPAPPAPPKRRGGRRKHWRKGLKGPIKKKVVEEPKEDEDVHMEDHHPSDSEEECPPKRVVYVQESDSAGEDDEQMPSTSY